MTTTTTPPENTAKQIATLAQRALYWVECGKLNHAERMLEAIEKMAGELATIQEIQDSAKP